MPPDPGIDEHSFTRKKGYATTFCDLKNHRIYDITLGRSEAALEADFLRLEGKEHVRMVRIDLATLYRSICCAAGNGYGFGSEIASELR